MKLRKGDAAKYAERFRRRGQKPIDSKSLGCAGDVVCTHRRHTEFDHGMKPDHASRAVSIATAFPDFFAERERLTV